MCIVYSDDCAVQIIKKRHEMAKPAINSKGNMKLKFNCGKPRLKTFWFYCLISNSHFYYTQNSSSATPGHVHCTAQSVQLFFFFFFLSLPLHTSGLLYLQSQSRILMPFQFVIFSYCIFFFSSFQTDCAKFCIFSRRSTLHTSTLRIN